MQPTANSGPTAGGFCRHNGGLFKSTTINKVLLIQLLKFVRFLLQRLMISTLKYSLTLKYQSLVYVMLAAFKLIIPVASYIWLYLRVIQLESLRERVIWTFQSWRWDHSVPVDIDKWHLTDPENAELYGKDAREPGTFSFHSWIHLISKPTIKLFSTLTASTYKLS